MNKQRIIYDYHFCHFSALNDGLKKNFSNVEVNVVDCPDLRQPPFHLAAEGKCNIQVIDK